MSSADAPGSPTGSATPDESRPRPGGERRLDQPCGGTGCGCRGTLPCPWPPPRPSSPLPATRSALPSCHRRSAAGKHLAACSPDRRRLPSRYQRSPRYVNRSLSSGAPSRSPQVTWSRLAPAGRRRALGSLERPPPGEIVMLGCGVGWHWQEDVMRRPGLSSELPRSRLARYATRR